MTEELLPKPQVDLPPPRPPGTVVPGNVGQAEKELSAPTTEPVVIKNETPEHHGKSPILKFLLLGILVATILAAIGGAYVLGQNKSNQQTTTTNITPTPSPTPDPTADWKTYVSPYDAFEVKYPSQWKYGDSGDYAQVSSSVGFSSISDSSGKSLISLVVYKNPKELDAADFYKDYYRIEYELNYSTIIIDGIKAYRTSDLKNDAIRPIPDHIVFSKGDKVFEINNFSDNKNLLGFISTFKFTDSNSISKPVNPTPIKNPNLNTYTSDSYNFSFQYPKDFVINNNSTKDSISFLQKQDDLMAQRLLVDVVNNPTNKTLLDFAKENNLETKGALDSVISKHEALALSRTFSLKDECGTDDSNQITRTLNLLIKMDVKILNFTINNSCETLKTDWLSQIIPTIYFKY